VRSALRARLEGWQQARSRKRLFFETRRGGAALLRMWAELLHELSLRG